MTMLMHALPTVIDLPVEDVSAVDLVTLAKQGDHSAYMELCRRSFPVAIGVVRRITKNEHDAEDVMQEALLSAFSNLHHFDGRSSFSTWFTRIGINAALMLLRKQRRARLISQVDEDGEDIFAHIPDPSPSPEAVCSDREKSVRLRQAVQQLPQNLRTVIEMRHANGIPIKEVAARMGISVPAVKSRLYRASVQLQTAMERKRTGLHANLLTA